MTSLLDTAKSYAGKETKNIAVLETVKTDLEVHDGEGIDDKGETFKFKYVTVNGEDYRVPNSVLKNLQVILGTNPNLKLFKVVKTGEGRLGTRYTVIPLA
jgi:hypothetical protein